MSALDQYLSDDDGQTWHADKVLRVRAESRAEVARLRLIEKYAEALVKEIRSNGTAGEPEDTGEVYGSPTIESVIAECVVSDVEHALRSTARAALGGK